MDRYLAHFLSEQLKVDVDEVLSWPVDKFETWLAYFKIQARERKKALGKGPKGK